MDFPSTSDRENQFVLLNSRRGRPHLAWYDEYESWMTTTAAAITVLADDGVIQTGSAPFQTVSGPLFRVGLIVP